MPATKDEIARKFLELAFRHGYRRTAVEDIARVLRISKKTIYDFFPSKEALLEYALEMSASEQRRRVESMLTESTALGRIAQVVAIALADARSFYASGPHEEMVEPEELTAQVNARVFGPMVRDLLAHGVAAGEFEVRNVELTAGFAVAVGMEAVRIIREDPSSHPEEEAIAAMLCLVAGKVEQT